MKRHRLSPLLFMAIAVTNSISFSLTANSQTLCSKLKPEVTEFKSYDPSGKNELRKDVNVQLGKDKRPYVIDGNKLKVAREANQAGLSEKDSSGKCWYKVTITEEIKNSENNKAKDFLNLGDIWLVPEAAMYALDNVARKGDKKKSDLFVSATLSPSPTSTTTPNPTPTETPNPTSFNLPRSEIISLNTVLSLVLLIALGIISWWFYKEKYTKLEKLAKYNAQEMTKLRTETFNLKTQINSKLEEQRRKIQLLESTVIDILNQLREINPPHTLQVPNQDFTNSNSDVEEATYSPRSSSIGSAFNQAGIANPHNTNRSGFQIHPEQDIYSEAVNKFNQQNKQYFEDRICQGRFKKVQPSDGSIHGEMGVGGTEFKFTKSPDGTFLRFLDNNRQYWIIPNRTESNWRKTVNENIFDNVDGTKLTCPIKVIKISDDSYKMIEKGRFD